MGNLISRQQRVSPIEHDVHGSARVITIAEIDVRLRWIPAGCFQMGSPSEEEGRTMDEGPQHEVEITPGFWLFETPVTQALWQALTAGNPSHFRGPSRPVECVSFHDVQSFIAAVDQSQAAFQLALPSEAQWEYACRTGTDKATWLGDHQLEGINNVSLLDEICWYAGNASAAFHSKDGVDSSSWPQCDHPGVKAGTHPVGLKEPNPWGLYDMLGNVWEWCADGMRDYEAATCAKLNPLGEAADVRCARGGSWRDSPRKLRASYRDQIELDYSNDFVGFRCIVEFN